MPASIDYIVKLLGTEELITKKVLTFPNRIEIYRKLRQRACERRLKLPDPTHLQRAGSNGKNDTHSQKVTMFYFMVKSNRF